DGPLGRIGRPQDEAAGSHQRDAPPAPVRPPAVPGAGHPRAVVHDRLPTADQAIEQGRFPDVGTADDGNRRSAGHPPPPSPPPIADCGLAIADSTGADSNPQSAIRNPQLLSTSAKSYDSFSGIGRRAASSSALTSSMKTRSSLTASARSQTRSRLPPGSSAASMADAGSHRAVVTGGPKSVFSTPPRP